MEIVELLINELTKIKPPEINGKMANHEIKCMRK